MFRNVSRQTCLGTDGGRLDNQNLILRNNESQNIHKGLVINYREGGVLQNRKIVGPKLFATPPPQDRVNIFTHSLLKSGNFLHPPFNMGKTSSYCVKTTPKHFSPHPLFVGVKLHVPPSPSHSAPKIPLSPRKC